MSEGKLHVNQTRTFSAHHMLLGSAYMALEDARAERPGYFYSQLSAITFCSLAIEALANAFGARFIDRWADFENAPPIAKMRLICSELEVSYAPDEEPWATLRWLVKFRNKIAHAKPEIVEKDEIVSVSEYDSRDHREPKSKLEELVSLQNAERSYRATRDILEKLCDAIPIGETRGLRRDGWEGTAKHIDEDS